jgi:FkbM family methyltransferase
MLTSASNVSVVSFEPSPKNIPYLISNLNQNRYSGATVVPIGLGDEAGFAEFIDIPGFGAGSHVKSSADHPDAINVNTVTIKIETLDNYFSKVNYERLDLIKIDAEGYELNVIAGCKNVFKKFKPLVIIEFNSWFMTSVQKVNPLDVLDVLFDVFKGLSVISDGGLIPIERSCAGKNDFIKNNHERGCVDNLVGHL